MSKLKIPGPVISVVSPRLNVSTRTDVSSLLTRYSHTTDTFDASNSLTKQSKSITDESQPAYSTYSDTFVTETIKTESLKPDTDIDSSRYLSTFQGRSGSDSTYRRDGDTGSYEGSKQTIISRCRSASASPSNLDWGSEVSTEDSYSDTFETASDTASHSGSRSSSQPGSRVSSRPGSRSSTGTSAQVGHSWSRKSYGSESFEQSLDFSQTMKSGSLRKAEDSLSGSYDYSFTFEPTDPSTSRLTEDIQADKPDPESELRKNNFISHLLKRMKEQKFGSDRERGDSLTKGAKLEDKNLSRYCKQKIRMLQSQSGKHRTREKKQVKQTSVPVADYGLNPAIVERLKLQNIMQAMKEAAAIEIHEPRKCETCREQARTMKESEAERVFVRSKCRQLQAQVMEERISNHLLRMNTVSMIGELLQTLPRDNQDPLEAMYDKARSQQRSVDEKSGPPKLLPDESVR